MPEDTLNKSNMQHYKRAIERILEEIRTNERFVITSHINPDGDGLGSELALYHVLTQQGKEVRIINDSSVPAQYKFMDPEGKVFKKYDIRDREYFASSGVIFVLDISVMERLGAVGEEIKKSSASIICIDHHSSNNFPGDILFIDDCAVATGELVLQLIKRSEFQLNQEIAEALYIALLTDTGCFRFSNTNVKAHQLGAELLDLGVDHQKIYRNLFENDSWEKTKLFASTISTLEQAGDGKIATMYITREMLKSSGAKYEDIEGFVEFARSIKDVLISVLFVEYPNKKIKLSFRSIRTLAVDKLAAQFGGGGHVNASAAVLDNISLSQAREIVIKAAKNFIKRNMK